MAHPTKPTQNGFSYEKGLPHQENAVKSILAVFDGAEPKNDNVAKNPELTFLNATKYAQNIANIQKIHNIESQFSDNSNVIDISMETGTGKTYTYTKTMYDLHRIFGIFKFIVIVPTLSIKAGTKTFLQSTALKQHFLQDFTGDYSNAEIKLYEVNSQKSTKNKKDAHLNVISNFTTADDNKIIHVLLINAGMINSDAMKASSSQAYSLNFENYDTAFGGLSATRPFVIIDEPHKFKTANVTWGNIEQLNAQYILRFGATFNDNFHNLIYKLTALNAFNDNLVKGVQAFIEEVDSDTKATIELIDIVDGKEAVFQLLSKNDKTTFKLQKGGDLSVIHEAIDELIIDKMNKSTVVLSNGQELKRGSKINPFSYSETLQDKMIQRAIKEHFKLERELLTEYDYKIKPLTLFFIDDITGYRDGNKITGSLRDKFESWILAEAKERLITETNPFYKTYLEQTIQDVSLVHGGYFSKDNSDSDEKIEQEIYEILHDKQSLLSLTNPRRFIFSKWTLREGWDNPNVFQICKLRSSGSTTSKLQEVGRGLRLPVNEYMARVKDKQFYLNYFVDSSENDFVKELKNDINKDYEETPPQKLENHLLERICASYKDENIITLTGKLFAANIIDGNLNFLSENSYLDLKNMFPNAFGGLRPNKIRSSTDEKHQRIPMREGKYEELKTLWEMINQKAILQYDIQSEKEFLALFLAYLTENKQKFQQTGIRTSVNRLSLNDDGLITVNEIHGYDDNFTPFNTLSYREFLDKLSQKTYIKISTLHRAFWEMKVELDIEKFLNMNTVNKIKKGFNQFLLNQSFSKFQLGYHVIDNKIHPTKFTDEKGMPKPVLVGDLGVHEDNAHNTAKNYLFDKIFYDSSIEQKNIVDEIEYVIVFTKIPKNSIKIPVAGGGTYSPDFAYIVKTKKGDILNFVIEAKAVNAEDDLRKTENQKIRHAEKLFSQINKDIKVKFETQFDTDKVQALIEQSLY